MTPRSANPGFAPLCGAGFYIALTGGYEVTWISEYDGGSGLDKPVLVQYLYSVYWALTTLTTVGYGVPRRAAPTTD